MASHIGTIQLHNVDGDTRVEHDVYRGDDGDIHALTIDHHCRLFMTGRGYEAQMSLLGFLDQMHSIRNALMDDMDNKSEVGE